MKTKSQPMQSKAGGVLVLTMTIMLLLTALTIGLFRLQSTNAVEAVYWNQSKQAFWQAEAGLQDAIQRLTYNVNNLRVNAQGSTTSFFVTNSAAGTAYDVTVRDTGNGNSLIDKYIFEVKSKGTVRGMNRVVEQVVTNYPGIISAVMAPVNINVAQNTLVDGPIMVLDNGILTIDDKIPLGQNKEGDYDIIILDDGATVDKKKSGATEGEHYDIVDLPVPDDLPEMPDYRTYYQNATNAPLSTNAVSLGTIDLNTLDADGDGFVYYNAPAGIDVDKITGDGVLVNSGTITINGKNSVLDEVTSDVAIMSFDSVFIGDFTEFQGNTLIYGFNTVEFGGSSYAPRNSVILADGGSFGAAPAHAANDIIMYGQSEFEGIIFADEGSIWIKSGSGGENNTRIVGTVISGHSVDMDQNSEIIFNPEVFYNSNDTLFKPDDFFNPGPSKGNYITSVGIWEELPPEL